MLKTAEIDRQRVPYLDIGPRDAPVIIFLHGLAVAPWVCRPMLDHLSLEFRVIAPYLPAITWVRSVRPVRSHRDWAQLVAAVCEHVGVERAHLVGQSTGGGIAACLAQMRPGSTASLTLISASGTPGHSMQNRLLYALVQTWQILDPRNLAANAEIVVSFLTSLAGAREQLVLGAKIPLFEDLAEVHRGITAPAQLLWGDLDHLFPVSAAQQTQAQIVGSDLHLVKYGLHLWDRLKPTLAADMIVRFARAHP